LLIACVLYAGASLSLVGQMACFAVRSSGASALLGMLGLLVLKAGWSAAYAGILWWLARSVSRREHIPAACAISGFLAVGHLPLTILTVTGQVATTLWSTTAFSWLMAAFPLPTGLAFVVLAVESRRSSK